MPTLVNPATGDTYDVPDDEAHHGRSEYGLITPEEWQAQQQNPVVGAGQAAIQGAARAAMAPGMALTQALTGKTPGATAQADLPPEQQSALSEGVFSPQALARKGAHPLAAMAGESVPGGMLGALSGGAGSALAGAAGMAPGIGAGAGLLAESAITGVSQEAVDAVTSKQNFSWNAALMNGGVNLLLGGLFLGAGHGLSGAGVRAAEDVAGEAAGAAEGAVPGQRNILAELDPGEVPEAITGGSRRRGGMPQPESAGSAAKNFDDLDAAKAIEEIQDGKVNAGKLAEVAPTIREQISGESARSADALDAFLRDEANLGVKHQDFAKGAQGWTPEIKAAQDEWLSTMEKQATETAERVRNMRHAGGLGEAAATEIEKGIERARDAAGNSDWAGRNVAVDNMKRGVDGFIGRLGRAGNSVVDEETRGALIRELRENLADPLREGLENPAYFGRNAEIQVAHNQPIHELIEPLGRVQRRLYEVTGRKWGEVGVSAVERRADPDAFRRLFEDPHGGGKLFQQDLSEALDRAENLARNRAEHGLSRLEGIDQVVDHLQQIRDDLNMAEVLRVAEAKAGPAGGHGGAPASAMGAIGSNALVHAAEFGGRAVGFPLGNIVRSTGAMGKVAKGLDRLAEGLGFNTEMAKAGTATRGLLDRYAERVRGSELLQDARHRALMPEGLRDFLGASHAQQSVPRPSGGGAPPAASPAPGGAANDTAQAASGMRWQQTAPAESVDDFLRRQRGEGAKDAPIWEKSPAPGPPKIDPKLQPAWDALSRAKEPMTKGQLGEILRGRGTAEWEVEQLQKQGLIRPVSPEEHARHPAWSVEMRYEPVPPGGGMGGRAAAGLAVAGGAGALLASGNAGAAELLPDQQASRAQFQQGLEGQTPDAQAAKVRTAEAFARIGQKVNQRVQGAVTDLFALANDPKAPPRYRSPKAREIDQKAADLDVPRHLARFMGKHDDPVDAFAEKSATITRLAQDPAALSSHVARNLGDLPRQHPEMFAAMVGQTMQTVQYLAEKMPGSSGQSALDPQGYPPTFEEISEWAGHFVGALHPLDSLDDLASNELVPEQVEAVQSLWPEGYQLFQTAAMAQIHELSQKKGGVVPLDALQQIDSALDLDGAGEPILSSAMAKLIQQGEAQDEQQKKSAPPPPPPMQSQSPQRLASSALGSLHGAS